MKKWEKEILQKQIQDESTVLKKLNGYYLEAISEVGNKIQILKAKDQTQSVIYQLKYQQELGKQLMDIWLKTANNNYSTIDEYLKDCYEDSFYSTMYSLHKEGIPTVIPFDQKEFAQMAAQSEYEGIKLSQKLYANCFDVATKARDEITKGIAMNSSYAEITRRVAAKSEASINQAYRIVRTEGHRIQNEVKIKTINKVRDEKGADVVKQWDSTVDKRTRPDHVALDGQLREVDQPFTIPGKGYKAMAPGMFGIAGEDINCRCVCLQRARWALDKSELDKYIGDLDEATEEQLEAWADKLGVSKDQLIKGSNGIIESDGSINHTIKAQNYNQFKTKYKTKAAQQKALQEAQAAVDDVTKLQNDIADAQNKLNGMPNKTYSGIWKDDVSLSDYKYKQGSIAAKKQWYLDQMKNLDSSNPLYQKYKGFLDDLDEFESLGSKYLKAQDELDDLKKQLKALNKGGSQFGPDVYSDAAKKAAKDFKSKSAADKYHRPYLDSKWDELSEKEKYSAWEYTQNSNPMNKPLSGYEESWSRSNFKGVGNVRWGYEDSYRSFYSSEFKSKFGKNGGKDFYQTIKNLTTAIDKMEFQDNVFLVRGSDNGGLAGLLESDIISFDEAKRLLDRGDIDTLKKIVEGQSFQNHSFMSTGIASGTGFSGEVTYKIYAPAGTHGLYAEPASYYGHTISGEQIYKTGQAYSSVGSEAEIILQRGTTYRITSIEKTGYSSYKIEMEVVEQPDYFKTGAEETFNNGATIHKS